MWGSKTSLGAQPKTKGPRIWRRIQLISTSLLSIKFAILIIDVRGLQNLCSSPINSIWNQLNGDLSPYTKKDIHKVEMVQRRATCWILSSYSPYQSVTELQQQLNLRTLEQRRVDAKVIMMFKIIHGLFAIPVPPYFEQPMRLTQHSHPLHYVRFIQRQIITNLPFSPQLLYIGISFQPRSYFCPLWTSSVWQYGHILISSHNST